MDSFPALKRRAIVGCPCGTKAAWALILLNHLAFHQEREGFHGEFDGQDGFLNDVITAREEVVGALFEIGGTGDEDDGGLGVTGDFAEAGVEFETVHAGHEVVEEDEVVMVLAEKLEGFVGRVGAGGFDLGAAQGVDERAVGKWFVVHDEDGEEVGGDDGVGFALVGAANEFAEKIQCGADGLNGGGVDVGGAFLEFKEQGFDGGGEVGEAFVVGEAGEVAEEMDLAVQIFEADEAELRFAGLSKGLE